MMGAMTTGLIVSGLIAGGGMGYVLHRGQLCFHSMIAGAIDGRVGLARAWLLAVALSSVGLTVLFATSLGDGLNRGLAFRPVGNVVGGVIIGVGMVVALSCASGLFYRLGSGMVGAGVGLVGWAFGELTGRQVHLPGPTVLGGGARATIPAVLGVDRLLVALVFLTLVLLALGWHRSHDSKAHRWQWEGPVLGLALALVTVGGWALAGAAGASFGPSTVGAVAGAAAGRPVWWLTAFLAGIVLGAAASARSVNAFDLRGERPVRLVGLAMGGFLLGLGGWIAGGCNLGHGLSGAAQLNVSSWVVVAAIVLGVAVARRVRAALT